MDRVPEPLVLLHGFSGTRRAWDRVVHALDRERYLPLALDLPGHGDAAAGEGPITFAGCVQRVLRQAPERFVLCGYSLGGRIALNLALAAPERVSAMALVSCSAGIEDPSERAARRAADERLAEELQRISMDEFIARWRSQPLFAGEPPHVGELARADMGHNSPQALAAVLRGVGAGAMEPLWGALARLRMPTLVLAGDRDERYVELGRRMAGLLAAGELLVLPGGHALALENPLGLALALEGLHTQTRAGG